MNVAALDIGGTKISGAILNSDGSILKSRECPTEASKGAQHILNSAFQVIEDLLHGETPAAGIGIASAGRIDAEQGRVVFATDNLPGWTGLHLKDIFQNRYHIPVAVDNDVNAAAIGEGWLGAAQSMDSYVCITLGTGVGGAFVVDKKIWRGHAWSGAELGHALLRSGGRACNCGLRGCVEQYVSGTAIINRYNEMSKEQVSSAAEVFHSASLKDGKAIEVIEVFKKDLIDTLLSFNNIFDPQGFVIGGGLLGAKEVWWDDVSNGVNEYKPTLLLPAGLGNRAGLAGAAKLIIDQINSPDKH